MHKFSGVDAFLVTDLEGADSADGVVRTAKKVLVDSTRWHARSRTYGWALLEQKVSGASAGVNAEPQNRSAALEAFCTEATETEFDMPVSLAPGRGVQPHELSETGPFVRPDDTAFIAGVLACAQAVAQHLGHDSLSGMGVALESPSVGMSEAIKATGAEVVAEGPDALITDAEFLFYGSKPNLIDHQLMATLPHKVLVPVGELSLTPRALAVGQRNDKVILADFLTTGGDRALRVGLDPASLSETATRCLKHPDGAVLGACAMAEDFLRTWTEVPFGRPIG